MDDHHSDQGANEHRADGRNANALEVGYAALVLVYASLAVAVYWLLRRLARQPPSSEVASDG